MKWIRSAVRSGQLSRGAWLSLGSSVAAEIASGSGFDWLLFDLEHGFGDSNDLLHEFQAIEAGPSVGIVRVPSVDGPTFKRVLDIGAGGLMIPNVQSVEEAEQIVRLARLPPQGLRGAAQSTRASGYGKGYTRYVAEANDNLLLVAQIESRRGVDGAAAIASVDGIDVLFVGPLDLSIDLGVVAGRPSGAFAMAIRRVAEACHAANKVAGVLVRNLDEARDYFDLGFRFIALGSDRGLIAAGMERNARDLAALGERSSNGTDRRMAGAE